MLHEVPSSGTAIRSESTRGSTRSRSNVDGKWGIQLSSIIFYPEANTSAKLITTPSKHICRQVAPRHGGVLGDHDYDLLTRGQAGGAPAQARAARKTASVANAPGATLFFLSAWAGKPMEPYNPGKGK